MCGKAILLCHVCQMCLISILVGVVYGGIICSTTLSKGLGPINDVKEILIHKIFNTKNALNVANSTDRDQTPRFCGFSSVPALFVYALFLLLFSS